MTDDMKLNIAFIIGGCLFIVLFIFVFFKGYTKSGRLMKKAKENGCVATGTMIKHSYRQNGHQGKYPSEIVTYEYEVDGKKYRRKVEFVSYGVVVDYPLELTIYYDKYNPSRARADVETKPELQHQTGCYIAIFVLIITIIVIYNLLKFFG